MFIYNTKLKNSNKIPLVCTYNFLLKKINTKEYVDDDVKK